MATSVKAGTTNLENPTTSTSQCYPFFSANNPAPHKLLTPSYMNSEHASIGGFTGGFSGNLFNDIPTSSMPTWPQNN